MYSITTKENYVLTVYSTMYVEWGLSIEKNGTTLFNSPHALSLESYGFKAPEGMEYEEAEEREMLVEWNKSEWEEMLQEESETFIEAFLPYTEIKE